MVGGPAPLFVGGPCPARIRVNPASIRVRSPTLLDAWLPTVAIVIDVNPVPIGRQPVIKILISYLDLGLRARCCPKRDCSQGEEENTLLHTYPLETTRVMEKCFIRYRLNNA